MNQPEPSDQRHVSDRPNPLTSPAVRAVNALNNTGTTVTYPALAVSFLALAVAATSLIVALQHPAPLALSDTLSRPTPPASTAAPRSVINKNGTVRDIGTTPLWTVPWSLVVDADGNAYLPNTGLLLADGPGATFTLELARTPYSDEIIATLHEPFAIADSKTTSTDPVDNTTSRAPVTLTVPECSAYITRGLAFRQQCPQAEAAAIEVSSDRLPAYATQLTIADLPIGAIGWTVPWALARDKHGNNVIDDTFMIGPTGGGTASVAVTKTTAETITATCITEQPEPPRARGHYVEIQVSPGC